jgi:hypothetical protein
MLPSVLCRLHAEYTTLHARAVADLDGLVDPGDEPGEEPGVEGPAQPVPPLTRLTRAHLSQTDIYTVKKG